MTKSNEQHLVYNVFIVVGVLLPWTLRDKKCWYNNTHTIWVSLEIDINQRAYSGNVHATRSLLLSFVEDSPKLIDCFWLLIFSV